MEGSAIVQNFRRLTIFFRGSIFLGGQNFCKDSKLFEHILRKDLLTCFSIMGRKDNNFPIASIN